MQRFIGSHQIFRVWMIKRTSITINRDVLQAMLITKPILFFLQGWLAHCWFWSFHMLPIYPSTYGAYGWFVLWLTMFSITVRDRRTQGKPEEMFHQHKNIRERKSLRDWVPFQNKGNSGTSSGQEAGLWLEGCHLPSTTLTKAMSNAFPRQIPLRCHRAPNAACLPSGIS